MHNSQGCVVLCTYCTFSFSCFQVMYPLTHVLSEVSILDLLTSGKVFLVLYTRLWRHFLWYISLCQSVLTGHDLKTGI
jgi:hypothetical protein